MLLTKRDDLQLQQNEIDLLQKLRQLLYVRGICPLPLTWSPSSLATVNLKSGKQLILRPLNDLICVCLISSFGRQVLFGGASIRCCSVHEFASLMREAERQVEQIACVSSWQTIAAQL